jgi:hypothetical protein
MAAMSGGKAGRLVLAVWAVAAKQEINVMSKSVAVLIIGKPRGFEFGRL